MISRYAQYSPVSRYLMALLALVVFIVALFAFNSIVTYIIINFFPSFSHYITYAWQASNALVGILGSYVIYRILLSIVELRNTNKRDVGSVELQKLILRVLFSFIAIVVILTSFGVSPSEALAGGAVGGVIVGLAVQTITTSILSGFLVSTSRTLLPGDIVLLKSSSWGSVDILVKITKVSTLYTEAVTQYGNIMKFPNPVLLNSTILTHLRNINGKHVYPIQVVLNTDLPVSKFEPKIRSKIAAEFKRKKLPIPDIFLLSRGTSGMPSTVYSVIIHFNDMSEINELLDIVNHAFDEAYWSAKK